MNRNGARKLLITTMGMVIAGGLYAGCSSGGSSASTTSSSDSSSSSASAAPATQPIPPDSIFAKIKMGEERDQVYATIGQPTSFNTYQTGKAFIPFHYGGGDDARLAAHYKGVGVITFSNDSAYTSGWSVEDIHYDPSEPGY
jgi:hypothetical protein